MMPCASRRFGHLNKSSRFEVRGSGFGVRRMEFARLFSLAGLGRAVARYAYMDAVARRDDHPCEMDGGNRRVSLRGRSNHNGMRAQRLTACCFLLIAATSAVLYSQRGAPSNLVIYEGARLII